MKRFSLIYAISAFAVSAVLILLFCASAVATEQAAEVTTQIFSANVQTEKDLVPVQVIGLKAENITGTSFTLSWEKSEGSDFYGIYIFSETKKKYRKLDTTENLSYTVTGRKASKSYLLKVVGMRFDDNLNVKKGKMSKPLAVRTSPAKVKSLHSTDIGKNYIIVRWNAVSGATAYRVYMYSRSIEKFKFLASTKGTEYTVEGLSKGMLYTVKVRAVYIDEKVKLFGEYSDDLLEYTQTSGSIHTNAQAAKYYNGLINGVKAKKAITVTRSKTVSAKAEKTSKFSLLMTVQNLLNMFKGTKKETRAFSGGTSGGKALTGFVQPYGRNASLRGKDIKTFAIKENGGLKTISLTLAESSSAIDGKNKKISFASSTGRAVKGINITKKNVVPVSIISGTQTYPGTKLTVKIGAAGGVRALSIYNPVNVDADCTVSSLKFNTKSVYTVKEKYDFK